MTATIHIRDHRYTPRRRWNGAAVNYYDPPEPPARGDDHPASEPRHHAYGGMSLAEIDAWLTRRGMRRGTERPQRVTHTWHRRVTVTDDGESDVSYRAVVLYWGRWDVARSFHVDSHHTRGLWSILCGKGVICHEAWQNDDAYAAWLMLGRVEQFTS